MTRWLIPAALALAACGSGGGGFTPTLEQPWHPATATVDYTCASGCEEMGSLGQAHVGDVTLYVDAHRDDPRAQWSRCFATWFRCWDQDGDPIACVAEAACPAPCQDELARQAAGASALEDQLAAYRAVFIDATAPCRDPGSPVAGLP